MAAENTHILVIRLSAMGDVAMTVPVLEQLINKYPNLKLTVLTQQKLTVFFEQLERTEVIVAEIHGRHKGVLGLWRLAHLLSKKKIDYIADLHHVLRSRVLCLFLSFRGIKKRSIDKARAEKRALTRVNNKVFKPLKSTHERYAEVFDQLGFPIKLEKQKRKKWTLSNTIKDYISIDKNNKLIGMAPFAAHEAKQYPRDLLEKVIEKLAKNDQIQLLLFGGGAKESAELKAISDQFEGVKSVAGKFTFRQELELISNLELMVSMDSGNGHLAALFGVEVLTIWGGTHPYAGFAPFGQEPSHQLTADIEKYPYLPTSVYGNKMLKGYEDAMRSIEPESIVGKLEELIQR